MLIGTLKLLYHPHRDNSRQPPADLRTKLDWSLCNDQGTHPYWFSSPHKVATVQREVRVCRGLRASASKSEVQGLYCHPKGCDPSGWDVMGVATGHIENLLLIVQAASCFWGAASPASPVILSPTPGRHFSPSKVEFNIIRTSWARGNRIATGVKAGVVPRA